MRRGAIILGLCVALLAGASGAASASTITVDTTADVYNTPGNCSLREAISSANLDAAFGNCTAGSGNDEIVIPGGTYELTIPNTTEANPEADNTQGDLDVTDLATMRPRFPLERVIVDGNGAVIGDRVLQTNAVGDGLRIEGLTLRGGQGFEGGGILSNGVLTLDRVTLTANTATSRGGGIYAQGSELELINTTVSGNRAADDGGGLRLISGVSASLLNTTVAGNVADSDANGSGDGGGIAVFTAGTTATLLNTLVADNSDLGGEAPDCFLPQGSLASTGSTLVGTLTGCAGYAAGPGDISGVAPRLGALAFNGGPNETRALRAGSPAINRGSGCEPTDQRGLPRSLGGSCDIGAYERARCGAQVINRVGTSGPDTITGTNGADGVAALGGNDRIFTGPGRDWVCAGAGHDRVFTRAGVDRAFGGPGADRIYGGGARDFLFGNNGFDRLYGGSGGDRAFGGARLDRLFGGPGFDRLFGGPGNDRVFGNAGRDYLNGANGRDRLFGGPGSDRLLGLGGRPDRCYGGGGFDKGRPFGCEIRRSIP